MSFSSRNFHESKRYTLLFLPRNGGEGHSFNLSVLTLVLLIAGAALLLLSPAVIFGTLWLSQKTKKTSPPLTIPSVNLATESSLNAQSLSPKDLQLSLVSILPTVDGFTQALRKAGVPVSDQSLTSIQDYKQGRLAPASQIIKDIQSTLSLSQQQIEGLSKTNAQTLFLLKTIPTMWPAQAYRSKSSHPVGVLSNPQGISVEPFTNIVYVHRGVDIAWSRGTRLVSAADGVVVRVAYEPGGFGRYIEIKHSYGFYTLYGHMQKQVVRPGDRVSQGDLIGYMGSSGYATGPHVHLEIHLGSQLLNPLSFLIMSKINRNYLNSAQTQRARDFFKGTDFS